jgi:hypothetical protein
LNGKDLVHDVTLSELIEACPQTKQVDGGLIYYLTLWAEPHEWQIAYCPAWKEEMYLGMMGRGTSPVEAVAKLWLALHNPK